MRLELDHVSRALGGQDVVHDTSLTIDPGEIVALVGLNGAGKTTLMRLVLGMLRPDRGVVRIDGQPISTVPARVWRGVGHLIEVPLAYPELTARANLRAAAMLHGAGPEVVDRALTRWRLERAASQRVRHLSLGTRQRVGLAAALQHDPTLVVLDEPSNALDPAGVLAVRDALLDRSQAGAAVLVSSHHLDEVARVAHRIVVMNRAELIGGLDNDSPELERAFFELVRADDESRGLA